MARSVKDMYVYEINIDSLFLINFVMNLYLYSLISRTLGRTATRTRIWGISIGGTAVFCLMLLLPGIPVFIKRFIGPVLINMIMTAVIFKVRQIGEVVRCTGYLFVYAFFLGGLMKFLFANVTFLHNKTESIWYILGAGWFGYAILSWWNEQIRKRKACHVYPVTLSGYGKTVTLKALSDTGNSLREPISGKPVSVIEEGALGELALIKMPEKLKIIPYHSVGKENGILEGYEVPELMIEREEGTIRWQKVIVGISTNKISANGAYQMILHPDLCSEAPDKAKGHRLIRRLGGE
ncbi:sigma-E processing peptidase SpoIIGA [Kineothrix sp. MB12-C1]|uniref:sigma-E processing peptidase SpoIIGA n=1 Tax=Kineothrix sp. MB12-C1 TaxID=3070215 RepID=UPI0027D1F171|nr:sigma-E processing peptidase SpoIIGA [Kineothrix sp. MB12-C1]WMC92232.1 sigma-E processing peptidase SpoIIGA [Kineothrix sp. MB12-C1]